MGDKPFKFEAAWLEEARCREVVQVAWEQGGAVDGVSMADAVKGIAGSLQDWSSNVLEDLQKRLKKSQRRAREV